MTTPTPEPVEAWAVCDDEGLYADTVRRETRESILSYITDIRPGGWLRWEPQWKRFRKSHNARAIRVTITPEEPTK